MNSILTNTIITNIQFCIGLAPGGVFRAFPKIILSSFSSGKWQVVSFDLFLTCHVLTSYRVATKFLCEEPEKVFSNFGKNELIKDNTNKF
jgi:hypothetical protein